MYRLARHGLYQGLRALGLREGDEVLVPAFHHGSEVEAVLRAGLVPRFYDAGDGLAPDPGELVGLLGPRVRALHLTHVLGLPQDAAEWRAWCRDRDLLLVEDAAQAWLASVDGHPVGSFGDLAVFSLYKTYGISDGGAALASVDLPPPAAAPPLGLDRTARRVAAWVAARVPTPSGTPRPSGISAEEDRVLGDPEAPASRSSMWLLPRVHDPSVPERRRRRYRLLERSFGDLLAPDFPRLSDGACPFAFPIQVSDRPATLASLAAAGIDAYALWSIPHPSLGDGYPRASALRERTVALPVHQELQRRDLETIVEAVLAVRA